MTTSTASEDLGARRLECWGCGSESHPDRVVHLGRHPEVALCLGCARWAAAQAWEIEERDKSGLLPRARDVLRAIRRFVVDRGWHQNRFIGRPLRWLGKRLP